MALGHHQNNNYMKNKPKPHQKWKPSSSRTIVCHEHGMAFVIASAAVAAAAPMWRKKAKNLPITYTHLKLCQKQSKTH